MTVRRVAGVLLAGEDIRLAAYLVRHGVDSLMRRDGALPTGSLELRDRLAAEAGRETVAVVTDCGSAPVQVNGGRGSAEAAAVVILEGSRPMTTVQAAARLGITARAVRNLCHAGDLFARRDPAGRWAIDPGSVAELAARRRER